MFLPPFPAHRTLYRAGRRGDAPRGGGNGRQNAYWSVVRTLWLTMSAPYLPS